MTKTKRNGGMFGQASSQATASTTDSKNGQATAPTNGQATAPTNAPPVANPPSNPWWKFWGGKRRKTKKGGFTPPSGSSVTGVAAGAKMSCKQALGIASSKCGGSKRRRKSRSIRRKK